MAHFARIDDNNIVQQVIVVNNSELIDADGNESEAQGQVFIAGLGLEGRWIQTSYNGSFRKNYAGYGYVYDEQRDAFIPPQPSEGEWTFDEDTCQWKEVTQ